MTSDESSKFGKWADLDRDALLNIFMTLNIMDIIHASQVCSSWRQASSEPCLWKVVDLNELESDYFDQLPPAVTSERVMAILHRAFSLSRGSISSLIFYFDTYITTPNFVLVSERTPNLKRLVLPLRMINMSITEFEGAAKNWPNLESLTFPDIFPIKLMKVFGKHCNKLYELKMMRPFDMDCAETLLAYTPNLRVLSLRCNMVHKDALLRLLEEMQHLQVLNLSHCLIFSYSTTPGYMPVLDKPDNIILGMASHLEKFIYCQRSACAMCQHMAHTDLVSFADEVGTLDHGSLEGIPRQRFYYFGVEL